MFNSLYSKVPRRIKIFIVFLAIILTAYLIARFFVADTKAVPEDFLKARQQSSLIAKDIVALSSRTADNINKISVLDKEAKHEEALNLISEELGRSREAREKAINLSLQLEKMAKNISGIAPASVGQIALQAVSSETALISRLIVYNGYLVELLEVLKEKFINKDVNSNGKIAELLAKINEEANAINELDNNFNNLMNEFDKN